MSRVGGVTRPPFAPMIERELRGRFLVLRDAGHEFNCAVAYAYRLLNQSVGTRESCLFDRCLCARAHDVTAALRAVS